MYNPAARPPAPRGHRGACRRISTAVNQGRAHARRPADSFNWRAVAASGLGAYAGAVSAQGVNAAFSRRLTTFQSMADTGDVTIPSEQQHLHPKAGAAAFLRRALPAGWRAAWSRPG